jgi:hypothetical protein
MYIIILKTKMHLLKVSIEFLEQFASQTSNTKDAYATTNKQSIFVHGTASKLLAVSCNPPSTKE